jgi:hypothetical protein
MKSRDARRVNRSFPCSARIIRNGHDATETEQLHSTGMHRQISTAQMQLHVSPLYYGSDAVHGPALRTAGWLASWRTAVSASSAAPLAALQSVASKKFSWAQSLAGANHGSGFSDSSGGSGVTVQTLRATFHRIRAHCTCRIVLCERVSYCTSPRVEDERFSNSCFCVRLCVSVCLSNRRLCFQT